MLDPSGNIDAARPCPYLGVVNDPSTSCLFASESHRCFRSPVPTATSLAQQSALCISGRYVDCPKLAAAPVSASVPVAKTRKPRLGPRPSGAFGGLRLDYRGHLRGSGGRLALAIGAALCVLVVAATALATRTPGDAEPTTSQSNGGAQAVAPAPIAGLVTPSPSSLAAVPVAATAGSEPRSSSGSQGSPVLTPAASRTALPTVTVQAGTRTSAPAQATVRPAITSTPIPTRTTVVSNGKRSFVVARGDTLWSIAAEFGVSVAQLAQANDLPDEGHIEIGQRLVLP